MNKPRFFRVLILLSLSLIVILINWFLFNGIVLAIPAIALILGVGLFWEYLLSSKPSLPFETGLYTVGQKRWTQEYARLSSLRLLYPSSQKGDRKETYLPETKSVSKILGLPNFMISHLAQIHVPIYNDLPQQVTDLPTILYVHGAVSFSEDNTLLHHRLVSQGYTVVCPQLSISLSDLGIGSSASEDEVLNALKAAEHHLFPQLVDSIMNSIREIGSKDWVVMGHSLGGGLAGVVGQELINQGCTVRAWINLDGFVWKSCPVPQLHLSQGLRFDPSQKQGLGKDHGDRIRKVIEATSNRYIWLRFPDAGHASFTDLPYILRPIGAMSLLVGRDKSIVLDMIKLVQEFIKSPDKDGMTSLESLLSAAEVVAVRHNGISNMERNQHQSQH